jgi:hypothetical protein
MVQLQQQQQQQLQLQLQQPKQNQQLLLRKSNSRMRSTGTTSSIVNHSTSTTTSSSTGSTSGHHPLDYHHIDSMSTVHNKPSQHQSSSSLQSILNVRLILQQLSQTLNKLRTCLVYTLKQIVHTLRTMETIIGIVMGLFIFTTLQSYAHPESGQNQQYSGGRSDTATATSPIVIGYAVSITGCGHDPITEGAAILQHSIHLSSIRNTATTTTTTSPLSKYDYQLYAIYHPSAKVCALPLQDYGYTLLERNTFVQVSDIQGEYLRTHITNNGCCGEKELIKLEAYTLVQHPIVVHLDLDTLLLQPMDTLFDYMLDIDTKMDATTTTTTTTTTTSRSTTDTQQQQFTTTTIQQMVMWPNVPIPSGRTVNAMYTYDYNMVLPATKYKPVQGGFLLLRPSLKVYEEFKHIVQFGDFRSGSGWGGQVGPFYGSMTFQGIIPYYYNLVHPQQGMELNRCYWNSMADNPRTEKTVNNVGTLHFLRIDCGIFEFRSDITKASIDSSNFLLPLRLFFSETSNHFFLSSTREMSDRTSGGRLSRLSYGTSTTNLYRTLYDLSKTLELFVTCRQQFTT